MGISYSPGDELEITDSKVKHEDAGPAEYSRDLGVKTYAKKSAQCSSDSGSAVRRATGCAGCCFPQTARANRSCERKSLMTDRVIVVPGPETKVETVRLILEMGLRKPYMKIVHHLNVRAIPRLESAALHMPFMRLS